MADPHWKDQSPSQLVEAYAAGAVGAWDEVLRRHDASPSDHLDAAADAILVRMMGIVARNADTLLDALSAEGWRLGDLASATGYWNQPPWSVPGRVAAPQNAPLHALRTLGTLPKSFLAFVEHVGAVSLAGFHPDWPTPEQLDPFVVDPVWGPVLDSMASELADWSEDEGDDAEWLLPLAPDRFHKANLSGGAPYGFSVPTAGLDAPFQWWKAGSASGRRAHPFVAYLRLTFRWGGFPGLAFDTSAAATVPLASLTSNLRPF